MSRIVGVLMGANFAMVVTAICVRAVCFIAGAEMTDGFQFLTTFCALSVGCVFAVVAGVWDLE